MQIPHEAVLLRIFIGESDRWEHKPLYEAIVLRARELHLAGATVLRGPMGYGKSSRLHTAKILRLSMDLPLVIEIVDSEEKIKQEQRPLRKIDDGFRKLIITSDSPKPTYNEEGILTMNVYDFLLHPEYMDY